ncbi:ubiquitin-activating enzyme E1, putative, partial [Hepatocystis sp. ex Piliocolobus tephrosceles]
MDKEEVSEKFNRQIALWGIEHQDILMNSRICFLGSSLLIFEIAKGLLLSGICNFLFVDNKRVSVNDVKYFLFSTNSSNEKNEYKCELIKNSLENIYNNVKAECVIANPLSHFCEYILQDEYYNIIICNLQIKENLKIEKLCKQNNKKVITCDCSSMLGYINICIKDHIYINRDNRDNSDNNKKHTFYYYFNVSLSIYNELKNYIYKLDYSFFDVNNATNKILFLIKCYDNFIT